jgi:putative toxin-antitoxin system antitoxin component (TIGR02293 family)
MVRRGSLEEVIEVFGGREGLGPGSLTSFFDFDSIIHDGMPVPAFRQAVESLGQSEKAILQGIGISRTTFSRRNRSGRLGFADSERAVRLGTIVALGKTVLGSTAATGRWLLKPNAALGGAVPIGLLQTAVGTRHVEAVLGRALLGGSS